MVSSSETIAAAVGLRMTDQRLGGHLTRFELPLLLLGQRFIAHPTDHFDARVAGIDPAVTRIDDHLLRTPADVLQQVRGPLGLRRKDEDVARVALSASPRAARASSMPT